MKSKGTPKPYRSEGLFTDYFLRKFLPSSSRWQVDEDELKAKRDQLAAIYNETKGSFCVSEDELKEKFISRVLAEVLGFSHSKAPTTEVGTIPDYALYATPEDKLEADTGGRADRYKKAIGVCEAKEWELSLDDRATGEPGFFDRRSPDYQIGIYLHDTPVTWGILTNGRHWRIYHEGTARRRNIYYEVDILPFVEGQQEIFTDFRYFYFFFHRDAFLEGGFLDWVKDEVHDYFRGLEEDLEQNVYRALRILAQGFFDNPENKLNIHDEEDRKKVRANCLIFLYRILFILYAESLKHLPADNPYYEKRYSLHRIKTEIEQVLEGIDKLTVYLEDEKDLWNRLQKLFDLINRGSKAKKIPKSKLHIPAYNGGLFKPKEHPFLEDHWVGDKELHQVIDLLARGETKERPGRHLIDYSGLNVTYLGGIYEGLLENKLKVADEPKVAVQAGKKQLWVNPSEKGKRKEIPGENVGESQLYPVTDKGERKATGSYYTPDYIVRYIVDHTLGPLCDKAAENVAELRPDIEKRIKKLKRDSKKKGEDQKKIEKAVEEIEFELVEPYLKLKVLDPAMGSGHFLVYATRYLGERIRDDTNVAAVIEEHADDELYWMRRVVERCIFGVDLNYLAVELAKLALWLGTFSKDAPLSFLDHHLRQGNSLIGITVDEIKCRFPEDKKAARRKETNPFEGVFNESLRLAVASYKRIESITSDTIKRVEEKEKDLDTARKLMRRFRELGDVISSMHFGNKVTDRNIQAMFDSITSDEKWKKFVRSTDWFLFAHNQWTQANPKFFHWELEFPEVFFDEHGKDLKEDAGFDVVIGNPPWGGSLDYAANYLSQTYVNRSGEAESHLFFIEKGFKLISDKGQLGYITPNTWLAVINSIEIREYLLKETSFLEIKELSKYIFEDAPDIVPIILLLGKQKEGVICRTSWPTVTKVTEENFDAVFVTNNVKQQEWIENSDYSIIIRSASETRNIKQKCISGSTELGVLCDLLYGIKTGDNEKFLSYKKTKTHQVKALKTGELTRYSIDWKGIFLWWCPELEGYKQFSLEVPKIVIQYIRKLSLPRRIVAALDTVGKFYPLNNYSYMLLKDTRYSLNYILGVLNSELINYYFANTFVDYNIKPTYLKKLPIRTIDFSKPGDKKMHVEMVKHVQNMLDAHKHKQEITKNYVTWLESVINARVSDLTGKERIRDPEKLKDIDELIKLLIKNRNKLHGFDPKRLAAQQEITDDFNQCKAQIDSIAAEISKTDREIDCLVYKLYELTPDEIEIVAGGKNPCEDSE